MIIHLNVFNNHKVLIIRVNYANIDIYSRYK